VFVLIPAFEPGPALPRLVADLRHADPDLDVLVVDDGSGPRFAEVFADARDAGARVVMHDVNRGKGAALKTGLADIAVHGPDADVVTADADGQHTPLDVLRVADALREDAGRGRSALVLGVREAREGVDAVLERAASLSGTVTLPPGASFDQGRVEAAVFAAEDATTPMGTAAVRPDGTYLVEGLRGASVKVRFTACGMPAAGEWWNNKADFATALTQTTVNGSEKKNVNVILATSSTAPPC